MIKYIGKCLLIDEEREKVLVIGDIHMGAGGRIGGIDIAAKMFKEMISELDRVFTKMGEVDKVVLLGDLKHDFSTLTEDERFGLVNLFDYFEEKCKEMVVVKGNHDNYLLNITAGRKIKVMDYFVWKSFAFLHGDRDFIEIYDKKIACWVMGHLHPAVSLQEGIKVERYKCFLVGNFKGRKIIILPSFIEIGEGIDVLQGESNLAWNFDLRKFNVLVVGEDEKVLDFGELRKLQ